MASVTAEHRVVSMSVDQLKQELSMLSFAGFGGAMIDFKTPSTGWSNSVTMKMFKPVADPKPSK